MIPCSIGRSGITSIKREGDGATPRAAMRMIYGFYRRGFAFKRITPLALKAIGASDGWCDAPADRNYNRPVRLPYAASHEKMLRGDGLYDICIVLDWNVTCRRRGRGSAIFLHLARPDGGPTEGCIAISKRDMARLLPLISHRTRLLVHR